MAKIDLENVRIAAPCPASWAEMEGDDRSRFCKDCKLNVYNVEAMSKNEAEALIEGNVFDACRHHIAATGRVGTSYEAAFNLVLEHANGHGFDMHGARDFDKRETKAIWRFDEGQGDVAEDSSIGLYHHLNHCTLVGMNTASCWVPGQINTALAFDGVDDHLECGSDASLLAAEGTIYFWLQAASLGQDADIVRLYEDAANYLVVRLTAQNRIFVAIEDGGVAQVALTADTAIAWRPGNGVMD